MNSTRDGRATLVVNFYGPELDALAGSLASAGRLSAFVRPYVNKRRWWERAVELLPLMGRAYARTFGRRRIDDPRLLALTREAGVLADVAAAAAARLPLPGAARDGIVHRCHEAVRAAVSMTAARHAAEAGRVVAFPGFAAGAFACVKAAGGRAVLNYPIAHHRYHRRLRREELERQPAFATTWPGFETWSADYEAQIDAEIDAADLILVGSSFARDSFIDEGIDARRLAVVAYGVDLALFSPAAGPPTSPRPFSVVYSGQISQRKGLSYLLDGYRAFARDDTRLTLIGNRVGSPAALQPYAALFTHVPHLTRSALADAYRGADVFLFPTLLEGMGLVVLEAMASGLPVIVTANGPGDIVRDGIEGYVVPPRDPAAISDRLERLYRDPARRREMGRNARLRALQYGWEAYAARVTGLLDGPGDAA